MCKSSKTKKWFLGIGILLVFVVVTAVLLPRLIIDFIGPMNYAEWLWEEMHLRDHAARVCEQVLEEDPNNPDALRLLALYRWHRLIQDEDYNKETLTMIERAIELDPLNPENYAVYSYLLDEDEEEIQAIQKAIELDPDNSEYHSHLGWMLYWDERYDEALASLDEAVRLDPTNSNAWMTMAETFFDLKRYDAMLDAAQKASETKMIQARREAGINPFYAIPHRWEDTSREDYYVGLALYRLGRYQEALDVFKEHAGPVELLHEIGVIESLIQLGRAEDVLSQAELYVQPESRFYHGDGLAYQVLGDVYLALGRNEEAFSTYRLSVGQSDKTYRAWCGLCVAANLTGNFAESIEAYENAQAIPDDEIDRSTAWVEPPQFEEYYQASLEERVFHPTNGEE